MCSFILVVVLLFVCFFSIIIYDSIKQNKKNLIAGYIVKTQDGHALASNKSWAGSGPVIAKTWACAGPVIAKIISGDANLLHAKDSVCYHTFI